MFEAIADDHGRLSCSVCCVTPPQVVFACPADTVLSLLGEEEASAEEQDALGRFIFSENRIYVHR